MPHPDGADVVEEEPDPVPTAVQSLQPTQRVQEEEKAARSESDSGSYYDSEESSEEESESSEAEEVYVEKYPDLVIPEPTAYFYRLETTHKDFIRSIVQTGDNVFLTASEDKTIKMFYFQQ